MKVQRIQACIAFLLMLASLAGAAIWRPTERLADTRPLVQLENLFPRQFANWVLDDRMPVQLVSPDTQAVLDKIYNQTITRTYVNPKGDRVMLSVAYGGDQSDATRAHRPDVCYPAQGFQIMFGENASLLLSAPAHSIRVRRLVARQGGRNEPITYWTTVGERVALSGTEQKLAQLSYSMRGVIPDGMLVRVSTIDIDVQNAYSVQQQFIADLALAIPSARRSLVLGASHS